MTQDWMQLLSDWGTSLNQFIPHLLAAIAVVAVGWLLARLVRGASRRLTDFGLQRLERRNTVRSALDRTGVRSVLPRFVGGFLFWAVWLVSVAAAAEVLGLPVVTTSLNRFAYYLPNVLAAVVIVFAGVVVGSVVQGAINAATERTGIVRGQLVGTMGQIAIVLVAIIVALEQLGINGDVLIVVLAVVLGALLATAGLAFGLGARLAVSNLIASQYVARSYRPGQVVRIDGIEGAIAQIAPTAVVLDTDGGRVTLPADRFLATMSTLVVPTVSTPGGEHESR